MVTARLMQIAEPPALRPEPVHILVVKLYTPAATKILSTALLPTAAVRSATVLTETSFRGGEGGGGGAGGDGGDEGGESGEGGEGGEIGGGGGDGGS